MIARSKLKKAIENQCPILPDCKRKYTIENCVNGTYADCLDCRQHENLRRVSGAASLYNTTFSSRRGYAI